VAPSTPPKRPTVGFIGLGELGACIAQRLVDAGFPTVLWARRPESLLPFEGSGATVVDGPAAMAAACDVVCVCVLDDAGVEDVVAGPGGLLEGARPGSAIAVLSTVRPDTCVRLAGEADRRGVMLVDAPVSGSWEEAVTGTLVAMVGGDEAAVAACRPVLSAFTDSIQHLGPVGDGERAKLVNNATLLAQVGVVLDAVATGEGIGVDPDHLLEVMAQGTGRSYAVEVVIAMRELGPEPNSATWLLRKDLDLLLETARRAGVPEGPLARVAGETLDSLGYPQGCPRPELTHERSIQGSREVQR
jgi:3-hydroxyisobutyrate dehydrogenase-like beta-hydroxyacid dehydrogenase